MIKFNKTTHPNCARGHDYALNIVAKKIVACEYIIGACNRYLKDLERKDVSWYFEPDIAEKFLRNAQKFEHVIGNWPTKEIIFEPWQCWIWMNIMGFIHRDTKFRRFRIGHIDIGRANAKAFHILTKVPTPDGMKLWKDIKIGSRLYDRSGNVCKVIGKNAVHYPQAYQIEFSDGEKIVCSDKHLWFTSTKVERVRNKRHASKKSLRQIKTLKKFYESVRTTEEIAGSLKAGIKIKESNHSVANTKPVIGEKQRLPVDPYVLGYWLGNGSKSSARISCHEQDVTEIKPLFLKKGYSSGAIVKKPGSKGVCFKADKLHVQLKNSKLLGEKFIPEEYFLSTIRDRIELVRGLLDSDGTINPTMRGQVTFTNKSGNIANGLARLLHSLGYKIHRSRFKVGEKNNFKSDTLFYRIAFCPRGREKVFNLKRKSSQQILGGKNLNYVSQRYITGCRKLTKKYPMFCVEVDSPDKSYLIGEGYIPTHNSAMASIASLYFLALDNPNGNMVSTVATKKEQARIVLDSARHMANKSKSFKNHTGVKVLAHTIIHPASNSQMRALSSEASSLDGLNDVLAVCDELHAMKKETFEVVYSGMSKRKDSLTLCITTAGFDVDSIGYSQSEYAKKVALGHEDEQFFSAVYTLDKGDDWSDENVWLKSNPNFGVSVDADSFRAKIQKALVTPADVNNIVVKHLNVWMSEAHAFFSLDKWDQCADPTLNIEDFTKDPCRMGLDLASKWDLTALAAIFKRDGIYYIFEKTWLPEATYKEANSPIYQEAAEHGNLILTKGEAINFEHIQKDIEEWGRKFRVKECIYDAWNATQMAQTLSSKIEMVKMPMNAGNLSEPTKTLEALIREGKVRHNGSKLLRWCLGNIVAKEDHNGNVFPKKSHRLLKIDPAVAVIMAMAGWIQDDTVQSVYERRGIISL